MKIIIGIILLYIIAVISSAGLAKYMEIDAWKTALKKFAIGYIIVGIILIMIFSIFHFCF